MTPTGHCRSFPPLQAPGADVQFAASPPRRLTGSFPLACVLRHAGIVRDAGRPEAGWGWGV